MMARTCIVAFDCETTGTDEMDYITCIASIEIDSAGNRHSKTWYTELGKGLDRESAIEFIDYLWTLNKTKFYDIITFNGTSFDFKFIAKLVCDIETRMEQVETLALISEDIMLDFATEHGYFTSLQSFADGCGIQGKSNTGKWAAETWQFGPKEAQQEVLDYCVEDVRVLCDVVDFRAKNDKLYRKSKTGNRILWVPMSATFRKSYDCITTFEENPVVPDWLKKGNKTPLRVQSLWSWI